MSLAPSRLKTALLLGAATLALATAQPLAAQNLTIAIGGSVTSLDPHFYNASPNNSVSAHFFDKLTEFDAATRLTPQLAVSWTAAEPTVW